MRPAILILLLATTLAVQGAESAARSWKPADLKLYYLEMRKINAKSLDAVIATMRQAAGAGYRAVVLADSNFEKMALKDETAFESWRKAAAAARDLKLEVVPAFGSLGYGTPFLQNDPHLAEGVRVAGARFVVKNGKAWPEPEPGAEPVNGGFEQITGASFVDVESRGAGGQVDRKVKAAGEAACRLEARPGYQSARVGWNLKVRPWHVYRVRFKAKTRGLSGKKASVQVEVNGKEAGGKERNLARQVTGVEKDQEWSEHAILFNSWEHERVQFEIGLWEYSTLGGTAWIDAVAVEPAGLLNVLRRDGCPVTVRDMARPEVELVEGRDYARIEDPAFKAQDVSHSAPPITIPAGSSIPDGATLQIGYYTPLVNQDSQVAVCLTEPKVWTLMEANLRQLKELFTPKEFLCSLDELRCANHCGACRARGLTSGQLLGEASATLYRTVKKVDPEAKMLIWNDIFDPHHNALRDPYYYVPGSYEGSWEGLPKEVIVANWTKRKPESQAFFDGRGHHQVLCGYYGNVDHIEDWLKACASFPRITGVMFCLYEKGSFDDLKPFAEKVRATVLDAQQAGKE